VARKDRIERYLRKIEFVDWDRFNQHDDGFITVFGWIDREEDEYKDFVTVLFKSNGEPDYFVTSSSNYSSRIDSILWDENNHDSCQRVENYFEVENCVSLGEKQTLENNLNESTEEGEIQE
jgi:hypothetical protein